MDNTPGFEIIDHPSDIGIRAAGRTAEELFEFAATGMFSLMTEIENIKPHVTKNIRILREPGLKIDDLFLIWLEELLYIYEVEKLLFSRFSVLGINALDYGCDKDGGSGKGSEDMDSCIAANISGEKIDLKKHEIFVSIKAPTYHMLAIMEDRDSGLWKGQVIFDV
jgi:SHS2 domain-containing protein